MSGALLGRLLALCVAVASVPGCAFIDQRLDLTYERGTTAVAGRGSGIVAMTKPTGPELDVKNGQPIIGTVKNTYGMTTAKAVANTPVQEWIMGALSTELTSAGYQVQPMDSLPANCARGVEVRVVKVWVDQDPGFWTVGALGTVQFRLILYANGARAKEVDIEGTGQGSRGLFGDERTKQEALKVALQQAMQQSMPHVFAVFQGAPK